jgi:hypothetical protein
MIARSLKRVVRAIVSDRSATMAQRADSAGNMLAYPQPLVRAR